MVHFFNSLLPTNLVKVPALISAQQLAVAKAAIGEERQFLPDAPLEAGLELCQSADNTSIKRIVPLFQDCINLYRAELYKPTVNDPFHRLQLHQAIMAAGFYERAANPLVLHGDGTRFVLNHYNFDVRRDLHITRFISSGISEKELPLATEKVLADLIQLERRLFGPNRLLTTRGKQWLACGVALTDVKGEDELLRLLELPVVKKHGNFSLSYVDDPKVLWKTGVLEAGEEETPSFQTARDIGSTTNPDDLKFKLRVQKPVAPLTRWERIRERLLRYWVIWLSFWITFWFIDEEVITLVSMIVMKAKTMKIQRKLAEEAGEDRIYVARNKPTWSS